MAFEGRNGILYEYNPRDDTRIIVRRWLGRKKSFNQMLIEAEKIAKARGYLQQPSYEPGCWNRGIWYMRLKTTIGDLDEVAM